MVVAPGVYPEYSVASRFVYQILVRNGLQASTSGEMSKYHYFLLFAFSCVWVWAAVNPLFPEDWLLENLLVFLFVPIIILSGRYVKLSDTSYTLITLFMIMHVIGSHYTYGHVPFGFTLQEIFDSSRNMYDRFVHFSFGLLIAYPLRELFLRVAQVRGFWGYYFPVELVLAASGLYEIIEWLVGIVVDPEAGLAFLGAQGDIWDAQKDMTVATIGAMITMGALWFWRTRMQKKTSR